MRRPVPVDRAHPANARLVERARSQAVRRSDRDPSFDLDDYRTRTHPDLTEWFYTELAADLPVHCAGTAFGDPVLVCPANGIVFASAGGTRTVALRLAADDRARALSAGAAEVLDYGTFGTVYASDYGEDWVFVEPFREVERVRAWCRAAYDHARSGDNVAASSPGRGRRCAP